MSDTFQIPAIIEGVSPLKDGGLSIRFHTNEVTTQEKVTVMEFYQKFGWLLFSEQEHDEHMTLEEARRDTGGKSPAQRLRAALFVLYKQSNRNDLTFEEFYLRYMEQFIDRVKENLE